MHTAIDRATVFNKSPHITNVVEPKLRTINKTLPKLRSGTTWALKHKHFDLKADEILLFEVNSDEVNIRVVPEEGVRQFNPCQAVCHDGEWVVVGVTSSPCDFDIPEVDGSGMITAVLMEGVLVEDTDEKARIQTWRKCPAGASAEDGIPIYHDGHNLLVCTRSTCPLSII